MEDSNEEQETSLDDISWPEVEWEKLEIIDVVFYDSKEYGMSKAENSCPCCGCPTEIVQCIDGTIEECRDISCPWSRDNG